MPDRKEDIQKFIQNRGDIPLMKKMLDDGTISDINVLFDNGLSTNTALMYQVIFGTIEGMKFLLSYDSPANPNIQDKNGWTTLHKVVWNGEIDKLGKAKQLAKVRLLLKYGADKTIKDNNGKTALDIAKGSSSCNVCIKVINTYKQNSKKRKTVRKLTRKNKQ
jgi:ankyrin repeat protein